MDEKSVIAEKLRRKMLEIQSLEEKLRAAKIYLHALRDVADALADDPSASEAEPDKSLRKGSALAIARESILKAGRPMHVDELLRAAGKEPTRETKVSLSSALSAYVRRGEIFTRPAMSTFGLIELQQFPKSELSSLAEPPAGFGGHSDELSASEA